MSLTALAATFATVFLAELPDKTMFATIALVARYRRPLLVWCGATAAFALHVTVAVVAGSAVTRLPERLVGIVVVLLFGFGAVAMVRASRRQTTDIETDRDAAPPTSLRVVVGAFGFVALAEWGDLTQLATAGLAARSGSPASVWVGAALALASVAALAAATGQQLVRRIPLARINLAAAVVFAALAAWTLLTVAVGS
ncbi:MAG: TMEM165/GDT1 family protein [Actinomycetota bacterium]